MRRWERKYVNKKAIYDDEDLEEEKLKDNELISWWNFVRIHKDLEEKEIKTGNYINGYIPISYHEGNGSNTYETTIPFASGEKGKHIRSNVKNLVANEKLNIYFNLKSKVGSNLRTPYKQILLQNESPNFNGLTLVNLLGVDTQTTAFGPSPEFQYFGPKYMGSVSPSKPSNLTDPIKKNKSSYEYLAEKIDVFFNIFRDFNVIFNGRESKEDFEEGDLFLTLSDNKYIGGPKKYVKEKNDLSARTESDNINFENKLIITIGSTFQKTSQ